MCAAHNRVARVGGYSPAQWALGRDLEERDNLAIQTAQGDPASEMSRNLQARLRAEATYRKLQSEAKISRALNSRPQRSTQFLPGDLVYFRRWKVPKEKPAHAYLDSPSMKVARFYGPARVLAAETKLQSDGLTRASTNIIWIIAGSKLKKAHSSQLRHASERERLIAEATEAPTLPWTFSALSKSLSQGEYEDLTKEPKRTRTSATTRTATPSGHRSRSRGPRVRAEPSEVPGPSQVPPDAQQAPADESEEELIPAGHDAPPDLSAEQGLDQILQNPPPDIDAQRLLEDPSYMPLEPLEKKDFNKLRRDHEQAERPLHVKYPRSNAPATPSEAPSPALWTEAMGEDFVLGVIIDAPANESEWKRVLKNPSKFAAKSVQKGAEVAWGKLNPEQKKAMGEAKQLEVSQWVSKKVCERFRGAVPAARLMKTRWVLVFKAVDGDESKVKCKARIVLLGFTDPDLGELETCAPTLSRRSRQLVCNLSTHRRWKQIKADAKSAFLQGGQTQRPRQIFIQPVAELAQSLGIPPGETALMLKAAYGLVSAPKEWFIDVCNTITNKCNMQQLRTDPCVWIKVNKAGRTVGYFASHVDDFLISGDTADPEWQASVKAFREAYERSPWEDSPYAHCGINLTQNHDFSFTFDHHGYCEEIKQIEIDNSKAEITAAELNQARAVLGAVQWRTIQTGPQHMAKLSYLQSALPRGNKETLQQVNKLCREVHSQRFLSVGVKQIGANKDDEIGFVCFTDAAVGNRPDYSSTGGYMVGLVHRSFLTGEKGIVNPIAWKSGKLARVAKSSLSAEIQALDDGEQELMYIRAEWNELLGRGLDLRSPENSTAQVAAAMVVDAKSVYDAVQKGDGAAAGFSLKEKYAALTLMAVVEQLHRQNTPLLWVASDVQLADAFTKSAAATLFERFLMTDQTWRIKYDPNFVSSKKRKQQGLLDADHEDGPEPDLNPDESFRTLMARLNSSSSETFWGMSVVSPSRLNAVWFNDVCSLLDGLEPHEHELDVPPMVPARGTPFCHWPLGGPALLRVSHAAPP